MGTLKTEKMSKLLIISHNCISMSGSNGRTLSNIISCWPAGDIAQLFISEEIPNKDLCSNSLRITDIEAIKMLIYRKRGISTTLVAQDAGSTKQKTQKYLMRILKNSWFFKLLRELVWSINTPKDYLIDRFVNDIDPSCILFQLGNYAFMNTIALKISKQRNIPLVLHISEDYFFKNIAWWNVFAIVARTWYSNSTRRLIKGSSYAIFLTNELLELYKKRFNMQGEVIPNSSLTCHKEKCDYSKDKRRIIYSGNLDQGRYKSILEIGRAITNSSINLVLEVYGKATIPSIINEFGKCIAISYKGFLEYDKLKEVMETSDYILHTENFKRRYIQDTKFAFSTKIADALACNACLLVYASRRSMSSRYLRKYQAAYIIDSRNDIVTGLNEIEGNDSMRRKIIENANQLAFCKHNLSDNSARFLHLVNNIVNEGKNESNPD